MKWTKGDKRRIGNAGIVVGKAVGQVSKVRFKLVERDKSPFQANTVRQGRQGVGGPIGAVSGKHAFRV